ncbi:uncharacterized protein BJ171DRAFT_617273 [Polychytrium aggregatum]|uniref:uncharacterized protein n=1 Tax=Polychytrium aggregatum TaxID=110093 RepID=UPI0022FEB772|nr:uncharacterized protein BJ171DRAFT_617273 [Polychytrium aggregatum]KAI9190573.1 hypothetical protein BJ171DRAFT_617273 [Polychytrium aggregatum]
MASISFRDSIACLGSQGLGSSTMGAHWILKVLKYFDNFPPLDGGELDRRIVFIIRIGGIGLPKDMINPLFRCINSCFAVWREDLAKFVLDSLNEIGEIRELDREILNTAVIKILEQGSGNEVYRAILHVVKDGHPQRYLGIASNDIVLPLKKVMILSHGLSQTLCGRSQAEHEHDQSLNPPLCLLDPLKEQFPRYFLEAHGPQKMIKALAVVESGDSKSIFETIQKVIREQWLQTSVDRNQMIDQLAEAKATLILRFEEAIVRLSELIKLASVLKLPKALRSQLSDSLTPKLPKKTMHKALLEIVVPTPKASVPGLAQSLVLTTPTQKPTLTIDLDRRLEDIDGQKRAQMIERELSILISKLALRVPFIIPGMAADRDEKMTILAQLKKTLSTRPGLSSELFGYIIEELVGAGVAFREDEPIFMAVLGILRVLIEDPNNAKRMASATFVQFLVSGLRTYHLSHLEQLLLMLSKLTDSDDYADEIVKAGPISLFKQHMFSGNEIISTNARSCYKKLAVYAPSKSMIILTKSVTVRLKIASTVQLDILH